MPPNPRNAAGRRVVRVGRLRADPHVRHAVGAARVHGRVQQDQRRQIGVGAGVGDDVDVVGEQRALGVGGRAVAHHVAVPLGAGEQRLVAGPEHPHRPARAVDGDRQVGLDGHVLLAAEAAADVGRDHPHLRVGHAEDPGDVAVVLDHLGRDAEVHHAVVVEPADAGLGLEVGVIDELRAVGRPRRRPRPRRTRRRHRRDRCAIRPGGCRPRAPTARRRRGPPRGRRRPADRSYSTSTSSQATASASSVSAITSAIGSPWKRTRSVASTCMLRLQRADRDGLAGHVDPDLVVRHVLAEQHRDDAGHRAPQP